MFIASWRQALSSSHPGIKFIYWRCINFMRIDATEMSHDIPLPPGQSQNDPMFPKHKFELV